MKKREAAEIEYLENQIFILEEIAPELDTESDKKRIKKEIETLRHRMTGLIEHYNLKKGETNE